MNTMNMGAYDDYVSAYVTHLENAVRGVSRTEIAAAIDLLYDAWQSGNRIFAMGNGGSASTASHFICDIAKFTVHESKPRFKAFGLTDNASMISALTNDNGFRTIFAEQLDPWLEPGDVLVGFSVQGGREEQDGDPWSQNIPDAMKMAKARGARLIGFSGFDGGAMKRMADICLTVPAERDPLGTAIVESAHVALHHMICLALRLKIAGRPVNV